MDTATDTAPAEILSLKTTAELEKFIKKLVKQFGHMKVNLDRGSGARGNGEGVWAVPASAEDLAIYNDETTRGRKFKAYLCNDPIGGWHGRRWGCPVVATTFGENRPVAFEADQAPLATEVAHLVGLADATKEDA